MNKKFILHDGSYHKTKPTVYETIRDPSGLISVGNKEKKKGR